MNTTENQSILQRIRQLSVKNGDFACFDLDYTLIKGDIAETTFLEAIEQGLLTSDSLPRLCRALPFNSKLEHLFNYYERIKSLGYRFSSLWLLKALSGLTVGSVAGCAARVLKRRKPYRVDGKIVHYPPRPNKHVVEFFNRVESMGVRTYVLSASYQIAVATVCRNLFCLTPDRVIAVASRVRVKSKLVSPYQFPPWSIKSAEITSKIINPAPCQAGKLQAIRSHISRKKPIFCISDSTADIPLLSYAAPHGISVFLERKPGDGAKVRSHFRTLPNPPELICVRDYRIK